MAETRERRQRRAKRPIAYLITLIACAGVALGSAWEAAQAPVAYKAIWRSKPQFIRHTNA